MDGMSHVFCKNIQLDNRYYLSALLHALGFSFVAAQNLTCFALLCLAGLGMYLLAGEFFGPRGGLVSAVAYLFAPYLLVTLYVRHALADCAARCEARLRSRLTWVDECSKSSVESAGTERTAKLRKQWSLRRGKRTASST